MRPGPLGQGTLPSPAYPQQRLLDTDNCHPAQRHCPSGLGLPNNDDGDADDDDGHCHAVVLQGFASRTMAQSRQYLVRRDQPG